MYVPILDSQMFSPISAGYVNTMKAHGGGDGPEAVTAALADAFNLPWRPNATKICAAADGNFFNKSWLEHAGWGPQDS